MKLARTYLLLAAIATLFNIALQDLCVRVYAGPYSLLLAACCGTGAGLVLKYLLDKRYIFQFRADSLGHDGRVFLLYTAAGLATTAIFWACEFGFDHLFGNRAGRYAGAVLGLGIGYLCKYQLDRRFVFRAAAA
ncbi:GtrA family protein [Rugamonas sp.]|uniref:GtrA family protein n=1 Tax=Rugamonas sp. TaxID=1926287 RepID=UPI0025CD3441|nr:GtrA family protein [Rugamonas sp.]